MYGDVEPGLGLDARVYQRRSVRKNVFSERSGQLVFVRPLVQRAKLASQEGIRIKHCLIVRRLQRARGCMDLPIERRVAKTAAAREVVVLVCADYETSHNVPRPGGEVR